MRGLVRVRVNVPEGVNSAYTVPDDVIGVLGGRGVPGRPTRYLSRWVSLRGDGTSGRVRGVVGTFPRVYTVRTQCVHSA